MVAFHVDALVVDGYQVRLATPAEGAGRVRAERGPASFLPSRPAVLAEAWASSHPCPVVQAQLIP